MSDLEQRIWGWLPARADRRRSTVAPVIAANLGEPLPAVTAALWRMHRGGHAFMSKRGSWHRGTPLKES